MVTICGAANTDVVCVVTSGNGRCSAVWNPRSTPLSSPPSIPPVVMSLQPARNSKATQNFIPPTLLYSAPHDEGFGPRWRDGGVGDRAGSRDRAGVGRGGGRRAGAG